MATEWFCKVMGTEVGPLTQRQLIDMVRQHQVNPEDLVRRNNSSWVPAFQVKGLFEAAAKPPAPPKEPEPDPEPETSEASAEQTRDADPQATKPHKEENLEAADAGPKNNAADHAANTKADWFCIASGEKKGPLGFDELKSLAKNGQLRGKDRVWRASWPKFQKAAEIEGLETV